MEDFTSHQKKTALFRHRYKDVKDDWRRMYNGNLDDVLAHKASSIRNRVSENLRLYTKKQTKNINSKILDDYIFFASGSYTQLSRRSLRWSSDHLLRKYTNATSRTTIHPSLLSKFFGEERLIRYFQPKIKLHLFSKILPT